MRNKRLIIDIVVLLLVILFLYTAVSKFVDFGSFARDLNSQPFPNFLTPILKWALPLLEIGIAITLLFERTKTIGLYMSLTLMSLFTIYTALVLFNFFDDVPCSCGGVITHLTWTQHLIFNLFFVIIISIAIRLNREIKEMSQYLDFLEN